jgi:tRNA-binding protein
MVGQGKNMTKEITFDSFLCVDMRVGRVLEAAEFPEARKPAYKLKIDFGEEIGIKRSSAQITVLYEAAELVGRLVVGVVNFPPRQIGPFISEVLVLGFGNTAGDISLIAPDHDVPIGGRLQ